MKPVCCVCTLVLDAGDDGAKISHGYCKLCCAAILRQLEISFGWREEETTRPSEPK